MKYFLKNYDVADPRFGNFILYLVLNTSDFVDEVENILTELRPSCLDKSTIIKHDEEMFITFMTRSNRREFFNEFIKRDDSAFVEPYYLEFPDKKENEVKLVRVNDILEKSHDVILEGGTKHRCFDTTRLFEIPTVDALVVDTLVWTTVKEGLPILTDDEDNEFLVTMRIVRSTRKIPVYYVCMAKYSENLNELSEDDFPEDNHSGWYNYDAEDGYFYNMEFAVGNLKREVVAWMPVPKPYEEKIK